MAIYLDNASTTRILDEAVIEANRVMTEIYGNPSSKHKMGLEAEKCIIQARSIISDMMGVDAEQVYFTSGGTEANNLAIQGVARAYHRDGKHIITTPIEHASVRDTFEYLMTEGFDVSFVDVDQFGVVNTDHLCMLLNSRPDTTLVSIMHVNNEMGVIQDIEKLAKIIKDIKPDIIFHVDGVQAFGKMPLKLKRWQVDAYSISAHKIHGPKGVGALYLNKGVKIAPLIHGGHQQKGIRSGTQNMSGIVAFGKAAEFMSQTQNAYQDLLKPIKDHMIKGLTTIEDVKINSPISENFSNHILSASFIGVRGEVLLHALEDKEIYVSTGSACSSNKSQSSGFLERIGKAKEAAESNIRFSFSKATTIEEIDETIKALKTLVPMLRRFKRK